MSVYLDNLTDCQRKAMDLMVSGENIFITGPGGVGKSLLIKLYRSTFHTKKLIGMTSTTGVSALLIGGNTLHSFLGIGLGTGSIDYLYDMIQRNPKKKKIWKKVATLIIDEVSMLSPDLFDKLEVLARMLRENDKPFGGIQLILTGDFFQLPVVESTKLCFEAESWNKCITNIIELTEIIRQTDVSFQTCLNELRLGKISKESKNLLQSRVGAKLENNSGIKPTKLYSTNSKVDDINNKELDKLLDDDRDIYQFKMNCKYYGSLYNREKIVEKYKKNCLFSDEIQLCVGAQVMLVYNIDTEGGLVNGSRGIITSFIQDRPVVKFLEGREEIVDFNVWNFEEDGELIMTIKQIPLKLAWAFTIHKIQGSTLDFVELDLTNIFEYGQAYVALSRVRKIEGLSLSGIDFSRIKAHPKALDFYEKIKSL